MVNLLASTRDSSEAKVKYDFLPHKMRGPIPANVVWLLLLPLLRLLLLLVLLALLLLLPLIPSGSLLSSLLLLVGPSQLLPRKVPEVTGHR